MSDLDMLRFFHDQKSFSGYENIPTTTLDPASHVELSDEAKQAIANKALSNDSFQRAGSQYAINPNSVENYSKQYVPSKEKGFLGKIKSKCSDVLNYVKKHKFATALTAGIVSLGIVAALLINKNQNEAQDEQKA